jgi:hypothetical protein
MAADRIFGLVMALVAPVLQGHALSSDMKRFQSCKRRVSIVCGHFAWMGRFFPRRTTIVMNA